MEHFGAKFEKWWFGENEKKIAQNPTVTHFGRKLRQKSVTFDPFFLASLRVAKIDLQETTIGIGLAYFGNVLETETLTCKSMGK